MNNGVKLLYLELSKCNVLKEYLESSFYELKLEGVNDVPAHLTVESCYSDVDKFCELVDVLVPNYQVQQNPREILNSSFYFGDTKQGTQFWQEICELLQSISER